MRVPHPNQALARKGVTVELDAPMMPLSPCGPDPRSAQRSAVLDELPDIITIDGGFSEIAVYQAQAAITRAAWHPIIHMPIDQLGQEVWLNQIVVEQTAADVAGTFETDAVPWGRAYDGDTRAVGKGAAIVVGVDLPVDFYPDNGSGHNSPNWSDAPFTFPGFNNGPTNATRGLQQPAEPDRSYLWKLGWCPGKLTDATPFSRIVTRNFGLLGRRLPRGRSIDVALVLRPGVFAGANDDTFIYGQCNVTLFFGPTQNPGQFSAK